MYYYVYILRSTNHPESHYTGYTNDYKKRLVKHNNGEVPHTSKHKPWDLQTIIAFTEKEKAIAFEKYLKSHSGRAFAKKHFWALRKIKPASAKSLQRRSRAIKEKKFFFKTTPAKSTNLIQAFRLNKSLLTDKIIPFILLQLLIVNWLSKFRLKIKWIYYWYI